MQLLSQTVFLVHPKALGPLPGKPYGAWNPSVTGGQMARPLGVTWNLFSSGLFLIHLHSCPVLTLLCVY